MLRSAQNLLFYLRFQASLDPNMTSTASIDCLQMPPYLRLNRIFTFNRRLPVSDNLVHHLDSGLGYQRPSPCHTVCPRWVSYVHRRLGKGSILTHPDGGLVTGQNKQAPGLIHRTQ